ncbi:MAG TPA: tetratricopeptide repeat protein, partial [Vicinamibacteria bacterium]|nr:tetratricopeptide repeat protein [Vicinamibacteria bacterium]
FERACAAGAAGGCSLAARVLEGASTVDEQVVRQVPRDMARAASLYAKGCDLGAMADCVRLGELYEEGHGVPKDLKRTAALYQKACDSGDAALPMTVCSRLALLYESGSGVRRDLARAAALYKQGCQQGIALDCEALEKIGKGGRKD